MHFANISGDSKLSITLLYVSYAAFCNSSNFTTLRCNLQPFLADCVGRLPLHIAASLSSSSSGIVEIIANAFPHAVSMPINMYALMSVVYTLEASNIHLCPYLIRQHKVHETRSGW